MSTPSYTMYSDPMKAIEHIEHEAYEQGLSGEIYRTQIVPLLDRMLNVEVTSDSPAANRMTIKYVIDWKPFNKVVDENRPLDVRTLKHIRDEVVKTKVRLARAEIDDGEYGPGASTTYARVEAFIEGLIQETEGR
jgi:hypothetical protein